MGEQDWTNAIEIETEAVLSAPTGMLREYGNYPYARGYPNWISRIALPTILVFATYSAPVVGTDIAAATTPTRNLAMYPADAQIALPRKVSVAESRRMARQLQERLDAEYREMLDRDAQVEAVWEVVE